MEVVRYSSCKEEEWNLFVDSSKNGSFLLNRKYMDYHSERFRDHSLLVYEKGYLVCVFPANEEGKTIWTHHGLTYGGLILSEGATTPQTINVLNAINNHYSESGFEKIIYKAIPWIYHKIPSEEDLYALFKCTDAKLVGCNISSSIDMSNKPRFKELRRRGVKKAIKNGVTVRLSEVYEEFWNVLTETLKVAHNVRPVHSLDEIKLLASRFPDKIKLYVAYKDEKIIAGTLIYEVGNVVHSQYIAANEEGKHIGALDLLFDTLINQTYTNRKYFDFGVSTENNGHYLNESLIFQKEQFGGHGVVYNIYEYSL